MPIKARLTFKEHIPYKLEHKLVTERGFHVYSRLNGGGVILQKGFLDKPGETVADLPPGMARQLPWEEDYKDHPSDDDGEIPPWRIAELERRCDRIVNSFHDPYGQSQHVRDQILRMTKRTHLTTAECEWVQNWIYTNVL